MLTIVEFNTAAYWGRGGNIPGGYGYYMPVRPTTGDHGDSWREKAQEFLERGGLEGRTVLDLGCGFGSLVRRLRELGADAYGVDLPYPISQGVALWPELEPYLIVVDDIRTWLPTLARNAWDAIISRGFLDCLSDDDLAALIPHMNRVAKFQQVHAVDPSVDPAYYNQKTLAQWQALDWEPGTIILDTAN